MRYFGEIEPSINPIVFAPDMISKPDRHEFGCVLSKDGTEVFFGIDKDGKAEIYYIKLESDTWSTPKAIFADSLFSYNDPMLSPDEQRLYFISDQSLDSSKKKKDIDIWYSERNGNSWSLPINAGNKINSNRNEYYITFLDDGAIYFSSNVEALRGKEYDFDIYSAEMTQNEFAKPVKLDDNINTNRYEADVFIAPDESYIIFCAIRKNGLGRGDLYISFRGANGNWTPSKNMGEAINSAGHELCPFVTTDGEFFFYTSEGDIYWVSTERLRQMKE
jgi:Tol biopolymer transport system component